jgi:hypothetical protein
MSSMNSPSLVPAHVSLLSGGIVPALTSDRKRKIVVYVKREHYLRLRAQRLTLTLTKLPHLHFQHILFSCGGGGREENDKQ